jgi:hypothetical protein
MTQRSLTRAAALIAALTLATPVATVWAAADKTINEASEHFKLGVSLYGEGDYKAALVEFKRAYSLAPNPAVLFNIGQAYFQTQNYAKAQETFELFLLSTPKDAPNRAAATENLGILKSRVGTVEITSNLAGAKIAIDDEPVGTTPLAKPVLVTVGKRTIVATYEGRPTVTMSIELAGGDAKTARVVFAEPTVSKSTDGGAAATPRRSGLVTASWVATGVLAATTATFGILALRANGDLTTKRDAFGPNAAHDIDAAQTKTTRYALVTDVVGVATLVVGGVALYFTLSTPSAATTVKVGVAPNGLVLAGSF